MGKKVEKSRIFLAKIDTVLFSSSVPYNADTTSVSYCFLHNMCSSSMGSSVQIKYN